MWLDIQQELDYIHMILEAVKIMEKKTSIMQISAYGERLSIFFLKISHIRNRNNTHLSHISPLFCVWEKKGVLLLYKCKVILTPLWKEKSFS